jgi:CheY-like chemotaxis protein
MPSNNYVLCIGQDLALLQNRRWILEAICQVETAVGLPETVAKLKQEQYALVVLCYSLTGEQCGEIIGLVRNSCASTKILALRAAKPAHRRIVDAAASGADAIITEAGPNSLLRKTLEMLS